MRCRDLSQFMRIIAVPISNCSNLCLSLVYHVSPSRGLTRDGPLAGHPPRVQDLPQMGTWRG